jgi:CheY-like chemotaxis protein
MEALVADLLDLHGLELERRGVEVSVDLEPGLACTGDPLGLFQVLDNLVRNAADAMPDGGRLRISTSAFDGDRVFAAVEDTGPGVDQSVAAVMFEPFVTTKSRVPGSRESGSGLGLDICRRIAREHGGDVTWSPAAGGGARFALELPRASAPPASVDPIGIDTAARPSIPPGVSVLVVDDEEDIREMIRTALTLRGARVATAADGEAALAACRARPFDLALVDFTMRGLAGHDLGRALVGLQPDLPLIFMSGDRIDLSGAAHAADFLKKPFDIDDIQHKVREVLVRVERRPARG